MNVNFLDRPKTETAPATTRRPLRQLADDKIREGQHGGSMLGRVLRETGRKSIEVAAFGSSV